MLSVFFTLCFLCLARRLVSFFSFLLFLGSLFEKFFGSELLFLGVGVGSVFLVLFCLCFCFIIRFFAPENVSKISLDVRSCVSGFISLLLWFFRRRRRLFCFCFSFKRESSDSHRENPTRTLCSFSFFLMFVPHRNRVYLPFWPCVLSFSRFVGVPFWAP